VWCIAAAFALSGIALVLTASDAAALGVLAGASLASVAAAALLGPGAAAGDREPAGAMRQDERAAHALLREGIKRTDGHRSNHRR
jgi:hypothetical protein